MSMEKFRVIGSLLACSLLAACLVPEKFTAKIDVKSDAGYTVTLSGTMAHVLALAQKTKTGKIADKDEQALKAEADKLSKAPEFKKAVYIGDGRYEVAMVSNKAAGQPFKMDTFAVQTDKDGVMTISAIEVKEKDMKMFSELGLKMDGVLEVSLPKNAEIISHNAMSTPSFFGLLGGYSWKIGSINARPMMKVKIKR
jgi:hypothetical protein